MRTHHFGLIAIFFAVALLSACTGPETPQEVAQAFWAAAIEGNSRDVVKYSTLANPDSYDGFSKEWAGYQPSRAR